MTAKRLILSVIFFIVFCNYSFSQDTGIARENFKYNKILKGVLGTYANPPLLPNGMVDSKKLISELMDEHANTYNWLIWNGKEDFEGLKYFLPLARKAGIKVWATLVPPSEPPASKPFGLDYVKWAEALAKLSKEEPNLVAWNIDDFTSNHNFFSPGYVKEFVSRARAINPKFLFVPTCYFVGITESFVKDYSGLLDGVLFPYQAGSGGGNVTDPTLVASEIAKLRAMLGPEIPIVLSVYVQTTYRHDNTTPGYVKEVVDAALQHADAVMIYGHQDPQKDRVKYNIIKNEFGKQASNTSYSYWDNPEYLPRMESFGQNTSQKNIVMLGNSLTERGDWIALLGWSDHVANRGIGSDITAGYINRLKYVFNLRPEICFIEGGVNDLARYIPQDTIVKHLSILLDTFRTRKIIPVLTTVSLVAKNYKYLPPKSFNKRITELNVAIENLAKREKVKLINLNPLITNGKFLLSKYAVGDGVHYNANAYAIWKAEIDEILVQLGIEK